MGKGEEKKEKAKKAEGKIRYIKKFKHGKFSVPIFVNLKVT